MKEMCVGQRYVDSHGVVWKLRLNLFGEWYLRNYRLGIGLWDYGRDLTLIS